MIVYPSQVLTSFESTESVYLYKVCIPSSFLDVFDYMYPAVAPPVSPHISNQISTVPVEPLLTFGDYLFALMLQAVPGYNWLFNVHLQCCLFRYLPTMYLVGIISTLQGHQCSRRFWQLS
ncbi:hypothetical protein V8C37DRAFT_365894 [Trichoderma ceciliae]